MMVINGKEIKRNQNFKKLDSYYFQAIKSIARESLTELRFVKIQTHYVSRSTDSIYFEFKLNHHSETFTLSLRTHAPRKFEENYFYIYLYNYKNLADLKNGIQVQLFRHYDKKAIKLGFAKEFETYQRKNHNHQNSLKSKKKNRTKICSMNTHDAFHQFLREFNQQSL